MPQVQPMSWVMLYVSIVFMVWVCSVVFSYFEVGSGVSSQIFTVKLSVVWLW